MLKTMYTWRDVYVKLSDGSDMRYSDYIRKMQNEYDMYSWITDEMIQRQREEEDRLLAQR